MPDDDDVLSDDEIEALLDDEGGDEVEDSGDAAGSGSMEEVREVYEEIAETVENILSTVIGREVTSRLIECVLLEKSELEGNLEGNDWVVVSSELSGAIDGTARYVLPEDVARQLARVMMGEEEDEAPDEFNDAYRSAVVEIYNQLVNSLATQLDEHAGENISPEAPECQVVGTDDLMADVEDREFLWVEYTLSVEDLFDSGTFFELQPSSIVDLIESGPEGSAAEAEQSGDTGVVDEPEAARETDLSGGQGQAQTAAEETGKADSQKDVQSVDFPQFNATEGEEPAGDINMLMDVPMEVSVELGRTKLRVQEILDLGAGSIIELDRLAGEPVDLLINGRLVARGEVVVIDDNFGVRVTSVVSAMERLQSD